jgi:hypothetical protein
MRSDLNIPWSKITHLRHERLRKSDQRHFWFLQTPLTQPFMTKMGYLAPGNIQVTSHWEIHSSRGSARVFGEVDNKMDLIYLRYQTLSLYVCNSVETSHEFLDPEID